MKTAGAVLAILALIAGLALVTYGRWTRAVSQADSALAAGRYEEALAAYDETLSRFDRTPAARQLFARDVSHVASNRLWALYRLRRLDDVIEAAEGAPGGTASHFWSGCAFFEKARVEASPEARLGWLTRAEEEFRKALDAAPDDWDTKYDFELTSRLVAELRKQPRTPPTQLMQLLRPPTPGTRAPRRVG